MEYDICANKKYNIINKYIYIIIIYIYTYISIGYTPRELKYNPKLWTKRRHFRDHLGIRNCSFCG